MNNSCRRVAIESLLFATPATTRRDAAEKARHLLGLLGRQVPHQRETDAEYE
jgi:hypothetical protein